MAKLNVAIYQARPRVEDMAARLDRLADVAARQGGEADILICPELFLPGYGAGPDFPVLAQGQSGDWRRRIAGIAREYRLAILYGYAEQEGGRIHNSALCIGAEGDILANHRKLHLPNAYEKGYFTTGTGIACFEMAGVRIAILICYDGEFPEAARAAAMAGAHLLVIPTALVAKWRQVAERVMPTRAFENGVYLAYANFAGREGDLHYCGLSCIAGPDGMDCARAGTSETVIRAQVDTQAVAAAQQALPYFQDRREGLPVITGGERTEEEGYWAWERDFR